MNVYRPIPSIEDFPAIGTDYAIEHYERVLQSASKAASSEIVEDVICKLGREAAAETGAIEGLYELRPGDTRTIVSERPDWEEVFQRQNEIALAMFEAQRDSYEYIREQAHEDFEISEHWIKELHARVCASQGTYQAGHILPDGGVGQSPHELLRGQYKTSENEAVRRDGQRFKFAPVMDVRPEMHRLIEQVRSQRFAKSDTVVKAAYVQYCLTHIHPFSDGNGRTARAFASLFTYREFGVPVIVYADRKQRYLQALENANVGRYNELVQHFRYRVIDTLERASREIGAAVEKSASETFYALLRMRASDGQVTVADKRLVAGSILTHLISELKRSTTEFDAKADGVLFFELDTGYNGSTSNFPGPYTHSGHSFIVRAGMTRPAEVHTSVIIAVGIANDLDDMYVFKVEARKPTGRASTFTAVELNATYEDAFPDLGTSVIERLRLFCESVMRFLLNDLHGLAKSALHQAGAAVVDDRDD
ncbi:Fic family protein [Lentzea sp. BCCO 10_0061]|uniref:Fic family protein n=1 Tax=Lentzea sokolovensis TaxID=3095429 RepID=A0ABU4V4X2_9PSEU|nr:Fic family protein [Lentzea sp. BCCO 10_0061]MDX8146402.1 Fic family protein [Lentzea sp. BCCO 10_0061]